MSTPTGSSLADKVVVVTGAAYGIGFATATAFASHGARVVAADSHDQVSAVPDGISVETVDLRSADSIRSLIGRTVARFGRIDILANMVAIDEAADVLSCPFEMWARSIECILGSAFLTSQAAAGVMVETGGGAIVNLASDAAFQPAPLMAFESAARGGIVALTRTMAHELAPFNIRVNVVSAGRTTSGASRSRLPLAEPGRLPASTQRVWSELEYVAPTVLFLASESASGMTGACVNVNRGEFMPH